MLVLITYFSFFFFNDTATTEIYTLSLHDALPISNPVARLARADPDGGRGLLQRFVALLPVAAAFSHRPERSEEHTSELQSQSNLVCRLLLEKKNTDHITQLCRRRVSVSQSAASAS